MTNKGNVPELDFITYDGAPTNKDANLRTRVRSHVTRLQHRKTREKKKFIGIAPAFEQPGGAPLELGSSDGAEGSDQVAVAVTTRRDPGNSEHSSPAGGGPSTTTFRARSIRSTGTQTASPQDVPLLPVSAEHLVRSGKIARNVSRQNALQDPGDQMARVLAHLQLDFSTVMEHYKWIVFVQALDFERIFMPDLARGAGAETLMSGIFRDPALVGTAVLVATGHILAIRNTTMSRNAARCIFELKNLVLKIVNEALRDPVRAASDPLICAVLILAGHEGVQGSTENFHVHMRGLVQMINLRGGLSQLNETQNFLEEYVIWQDTNVSAIMGCEPYWNRTMSQSKDLPTVEANPAMWLLKEV